MTTPCAQCEDVETRCHVCPPFLRWWGEAHPADPEPEPCLTCLDVAVLREAGEDIQRIAERLGYRSWQSLETHLRRAGQPLPRRRQIEFV